jgi:hypothetical protein
VYVFVEMEGMYSVVFPLSYFVMFVRCRDSASYLSSIISKVLYIGYAFFSTNWVSSS